MSAYFRPIPSVLTANSRTVTTIAEYDTAYAATTSGVDSEIIFRGGTYGGAPTVFKRTIAKNKLQLKAFPGERVIIKGNFLNTAQDVWFIGLEIDGEDYGCSPGDVNGNTGITNTGLRCSIINCFIHNQDTSGPGEPNCGQQTILDNATATGSLVYQNILTNARHTVYIQNNSAAPGFAPKHWIRNYIGDVKQDLSGGGGNFVVHGYASSPQFVQAIELQGNIIANGSNIMGSDGTGNPSGGVHKGMVVTNNIFFRSNWALFRRPQEIIFEDNKLLEAPADTGLSYITGTILLDWQQLHGEGEGFFGYGNPSTCQNNVLYHPVADRQYITLRPTFYNSGGAREECTGQMRDTSTGEIFDNNTYHHTASQFRGSLCASNIFSAGITGIAGWRSTCLANAGHPVDANSTEVSGPPPDFVEIIPNEYDNNRALLFVWNADGAGSVNVDLPDDRIGNIFPVRSGGWGSPDYSGANNYNVTPNEGRAYIGLIKFTEGTDVQIIRPIATVTNPEGYTDQGGGSANLHTVLDEVNPDDNDYIQSALAPTNDPVYIPLAAGTDPTTSSGYVATIRYRKNAAGGATVNGVFQVRQDYVNEGSPGTLIATRNVNDYTDAWTSFNIVLTGPEADTITGPGHATLGIRIVTNQV